MAKQLNVNLAFTADTSQAKAQLQDLQNQLSKIVSYQPSTQLGLTKNIREASQAAAELSAHIRNAANEKTGNLDFSKLTESLKRGGQSLEQYASKLRSLGPQGEQAFSSLAQSVVNAEVPLRRSNKLLTDLWVTLKNTARWQISSSILHGFMGSIQSAYGYAQDLNESLNNIRIVTGYNVDQMSRFATEANKVAKALKTTTTSYTNASLIYYQQGLNDQEVKDRTDITVKMANVARESAETVSDQMTAVWNNFYDGSKSLEYYADVMTALGAATASSTSEISEGLEKFAAVADTVGLSYEYATAALATVTATTRQSADVVGTAFKTLFARIQDLELGETLEDGTTLGKYSEALNAVGINILDASGNLMEMDDILDAMAGKWDTLTKAQQTSLAQTVAGTRQYTQLVALMENWDFMQENLGVVADSEGTLQGQADIYAESWEAASMRVRAAAEGIYQTLLNDEAFIDILNGFEKLLTFFDNLIDTAGGLSGVLTNLGGILFKVFSKEISQSMSNMAYSMRMMTKSGREGVQQEKFKVLENLSKEVTSDDAVTKEQEIQSKTLKNTLSLQTTYLENAERMSVIEQQTNQALMDRQKIFAQEAIEAAKRADIASENFSDIEFQARTRIAEKVTNMPSVNNETKEETKQRQQKNFKNLTDDYLKRSKSLQKSIVLDIKADKAEQELKEIGKVSKDTIKDLNTLIAKMDLADGQDFDVSSLLGELEIAQESGEDTTLAFQKLRDAILEITLLNQQELVDLNIAGIDTEYVDQYTESYRKKAEAADNSAEATKRDEEATKNANEAILKAQGNQKQWTDSLTEFAGTAFTAMSVMQAFSGIFETLVNPDMTGWEKFTSILGTVVMLLPQVVSSITTYTTSAAAMKVAQDALSASTGTQTVAVNTNKLAWLSHPIFGIVVAALTAVMGIISLVSSHLEEQTKQIKENAEETRKEAQAKREEAQANYELVNSYQEILKIYQETGERKDELIKKAIEAGEAYDIERAAILALNGDYEKLNAEIVKNRKLELEANKDKTKASTRSSAEAVTASMRAGKGHLSGKTGYAATFDDDSFWTAWGGLDADKLIKDLFEENSYNYLSRVNKGTFLDPDMRVAADVENITDPEEVRAYVEELKIFMDDFTALAEEKGLNAGASEVFKAVKEEYQQAQEIYGDFITELEEGYKIEYELAALNAKQDIYGIDTLEEFTQFKSEYLASVEKSLTDQGIEKNTERYDELINNALIYLKEYEHLIDFINTNNAFDDLIEQDGLDEEKKKELEKIKKWYSTLSEEEQNLLWTIGIDENSTRDELESTLIDAQNYLDNNELIGKLKVEYNPEGKKAELLEAIEAGKFATEKGMEEITALFAEVKKDIPGWENYENFDDLIKEVGFEDIIELLKTEGATISQQKATVARQKAESQTAENEAQKRVDNAKATSDQRRAAAGQEAVDAYLADPDVQLEKKFNDWFNQAISGQLTIPEIINTPQFKNNLSYLGVAEDWYEGEIKQFTPYQLEQQQRLTNDLYNYYKEQYGADSNFEAYIGRRVVGNLDLAKSIGIERTEENEQRFNNLFLDWLKNSGISYIPSGMASENYLENYYGKTEDDIRNKATGDWVDTELETAKDDLDKAQDKNVEQLKAEESLRILQRQELENLGIETQEIDDYTEALLELYPAQIKTKKEAEEITYANKKLNIGLSDIINGWDNWKDSLKTGDFTDPETIKALRELEDALKNVFNINEVEDEFIIKNLEDIEAAAEGDIEAIERLKKAHAEFLAEQAGLVGDDLALIKDAISNFEMDDFVIGTSLDETQLTSVFAELLTKGKITAEQLENILSSIGFTPKLTWTKVEDETWQEVSSNAYVIDETTGAYQKITSEKQFNTATAVYIPTINGEDTSYQGPPAATVKGTADKAGGNTSPAKKVDRTKKTDVVERYKEVEDSIDDLNDTLEDINKQADRLYGASRLAQMKKANDLVEDEIDLLKEKKRQAQDYLKQDFDALGQAAANAGVVFELDEKGNITNYTEQMSALYEELAAAEHYMDTAFSTSEDQDEYQESTVQPIQDKIDELTEAISQYEETRELLEDLDDEIDDKFYEWQDANYEMLTYEIEFKLEVNDLELKRIDYYLSKYNDDVYAQAEAVFELSKKKDFYLEQLEIENYRYEELQRKYEAGEISQADYADGLKTTAENTWEAAEQLREYDNEMMEFYSNTLTKVNEEVTKYTDNMDAAVSALEHYKNIAKLAGREQDYSLMGAMLEGSVKMKANDLAVSKQMYQNATSEVERIKGELAAATSKEQRELLQKELDAAEAQANEWQEKMLTDVEEYLTAQKELYDNNIEALNASFEKLATGGDGFDVLKNKMSSLSEHAEEFLTDTNKIYETEKMIRNIDKEIGSTSNTIAQQKLKAFRQQTQELQNQEELSQFELDIQQAKYDLLLAEIALEESRNAKTTMRLARDAMGNYSYVYTADAEKVAEAEQQVSDAQNKLYNTRLDGANKYGEQLASIRQEWIEAIEGLDRNDADYYAKRDALNEYYMGKMADVSHLYAIATGEDATIAQEAWTTSIVTQIGSVEDFEQNMKTYLSNIDAEWDTYKEKVDEVTTDVGLNLDDAETSIKDLTDKHEDLRKKLVDEVIPALQTETTEVGNVVSAYGDLRQGIVDTIAEYEKLGNAATDAYNKIANTPDTSGENENTEDNNTDLPGDTMGYVPEPSGQGIEEDTESYFPVTITGKVTTTQGKTYYQANGQKWYSEEDLSGNLGETIDLNLNAKGYRDTDIVSTYSLSTITDSHKKARTITPYDGEGNPKEKIKLNDEEFNALKNNTIIGYRKTDTANLYRLHHKVGSGKSETWWINKTDLNQLMNWNDVDLHKRFTLAQMSTGGYTGQWGPSGKLAVLHEKELVLNKQDTENLLKVIDIIRANKLIDAQVAQLQHDYTTALLEHELTKMTALFGELMERQEEAPKEVNIYADFPGVHSAIEIETALRNLANDAAQYSGINWD